MRIHIKFMVSPRCIVMVEAALGALGLSGSVVVLGQAEIPTRITLDQHCELKASLAALGLELMDDERATLIERIEAVIVEMVDGDDDTVRETKNSAYISSRLNYNYTYLANTFAIATGSTIERFIIYRKIQRIKELLRYDKLTLTQISYKLNYSSVAHLCKQFKKATGLTTSGFMRIVSLVFVALESIWIAN
ncbi:helix-turn-helix domain-containing protein [Hymenobacter siberiensis]|jgi:AraC-like DNA-binding protein|uniref:helix-turn-helix domain-containing protein n=1 Tax=Hymenobacter siberiensis TaxID=2848396 RepID=UPI001C1E7951|nr:AraC family transcriptional regulator [Hymenobacter siberiensis]MBU6120207.1 AraC family transcriptional regulator [Hymenobacter siberiensis]